MQLAPAAPGPAVTHVDAPPGVEDGTQVWVAVHDRGQEVSVGLITLQSGTQNEPLPPSPVCSHAFRVGQSLRPWHMKA